MNNNINPNHSVKASPAETNHSPSQNKTYANAISNKEPVASDNNQIDTGTL